jgi:hypothetical protein
MKPFKLLLPLLPLLVEGATQSGFLRKHSRSITILGKNNLTSKKEKRQWAELGKVLSNGLSLLRQNVTKIEDLKPTLNISGVKRKRFIYGPYKAFGLDVSACCVF